MKALLVISFGTTYPKTREKTIDAIEKRLQDSFPDRRLYRAWTSGFIRRKLAQRDSIFIDSPEEAFARMRSEGVTDVLIQPTQVIPGAEYRKILTAAEHAGKDFHTVSIGTPLLASGDDLRDVASALIREFADLASDEALVLMGHGSPEGGNEIYTRLEEEFRRQGFVHTYIGLVEASPGLEDVLSRLRTSDRRRVRLAPLLVVAGDHALHDMAGEQEDSWASVLSANEFDVTCCVRGLGEYESIRDIYVAHGKAALE